jgi:hypothetical protein
MSLSEFCIIGFLICVITTTAGIAIGFPWSWLIYAIHTAVIILLFKWGVK